MTDAPRETPDTEDFNDTFTIQGTPVHTPSALKSNRETAALKKKSLSNENTVKQEEQRELIEHRKNVFEKTDMLSSISTRWHPASRDWKMCGVSMLILLLIVSGTLIVTEALKNYMLIGFFILFIAFLGIISGYFFFTALKMSDFMALYIFDSPYPQKLLERLQKRLTEKLGDPEEIKPVIGHSFGLLTPVKALHFRNGVIIDMEKLHITFGFVIGLYLLVKATESSEVWNIVDKERSSLR